VEVALKIYTLSAVLLLALPAFAQIADVQNASNFACSGSTCQVILSTQPHTTLHNLIAVWTFWQSSSVPAYTASVFDSNSLNTFYSAVGPTLQSASSPPISAQVFYARNINPSTGHDAVTVTFSGGTGSISAGAVAVEYSGLDRGNPLDDVSAGYSNSGSPGSMFDSGWAPLGLVPPTSGSNQNVLIFGAAVADASGTPTVGSNFTLVQSNGSSLGLCGLTEEQIFVASASSFQHANASCGSSNWLAQMAVFRSATWTVAGGWSPVRPYKLFDATQYPGVDACAQTQAAVESGGGATPVVSMGGFSNTAITCKNPPFGTGDNGEISLPVGILQITYPWVFPNNGMILHGHGRGTATVGTYGTIIQAQSALNSGTTPGAIFQMGTSPTLQFGNYADHLTLDVNGQTGSSGIIDDLCQEECGFDYLHVIDATVADVDFGLNSGLMQHGINFSNFEIGVGSTQSATCAPTVSALAITGISLGGTGNLTATVSVGNTTGLLLRNEVIISNWPVSYYDNTWEITYINPGVSFNIQVKSGAPSPGSASGIPTASTYVMPLRVWSLGGSSERDIHDGTVNMGNCGTSGTGHPLPNGAFLAEFSGQSQLTVRNLHEEELGIPTSNPFVGIDIGGLGPTSNLTIEGGDGDSFGSGGALNPTGTDIQINSSFCPVTNLTIHNRQDISTNPPLKVIVDECNGNTITYAHNPGVLEYKLDGSGFPHALLANCVDMTNGWCDDGSTNSLYSSGSKTLSIKDSTGLLTVLVAPLSGLPACGATTESAHAVANNCAAACSAGGACLTGGSTHCELYCNGGTSWIETGR
jgi:hypothetical protein